MGIQIVCAVLESARSCWSIDVYLCAGVNYYNAAHDRNGVVIRNAEPCVGGSTIRSDKYSSQTVELNKRVYLLVPFCDLGRIGENIFSFDG